MKLLALALATLLIAADALPEDDLRDKVLANYNPNSLPNVLTNISIRLTVLHLDLDEKRQLLMLDSWLAMDWQDPRLTWDNGTYPISKLAFTRDQVWTPDITLYNNGEASIADHLASILVLALPTGKMIFVPTAMLPAACVLDMTYWPHDVHNCTVKFGSWVHSGYSIDLIPKDNVAEFDIKTKTSNGLTLSRGQWEILSSSVTRHSRTYDCCGTEPYIHIEGQIIVRRNAPAYVWLVKLPFAVLGIATALVFIMPPGSAHKMIFGALLLILNMQFLAYTREIVLFSPSHTPIIIQLVSEQLLCTLISVVVCGVVVRMVRDPHSDGLPSPLKRLTSVLGAGLLLGNYRKLVTGTSAGSYPQSIKGEEVEMAGERGGMMAGGSGSEFEKMSSEQAQWLLLGAVIDRILLVLYIVCYIYKFIKYCAVF